VAAGLAYMHRHGVVHMDVKPSNLYVAMSGAIKLVSHGATAQSHTALPHCTAWHATAPHATPPHRTAHPTWCKG